jgi:hypothetical protein
MLEMLFNIVAETKTYPRIVQADNRRQRSSRKLRNGLRAYQIYKRNVIVFSESNGLVEGTPKVERFYIEIMIRTNGRIGLNIYKRQQNPIE